MWDVQAAESERSPKARSRPRASSLWMGRKSRRDDGVAHHTPVEWRRPGERPGMTVLRQIDGRSDRSWDETVQLDLSYVDNRSFTSVDGMSRTFRAVVDGRGAYRERRTWPDSAPARAVHRGP
ncbi:sugar transferase [Streptomyces sp. NPDC004044]